MTTTTPFDQLLRRQKRYLLNDLLHLGFVAAAVAPILASLL